MTEPADDGTHVLDARPDGEVAEVGRGTESAGVYRTVRAVLGCDTSPDGVVRLDTMTRYAQDAGLDHLALSGEVHEDSFWIVRRSVVEVRVPLREPGPIALERRCTGYGRLWCRMDVHLTTAEGGDATVTGFWVHVRSDGTPLRMSDRFRAYLGQTTDDDKVRWASAFDHHAPPGQVRRGFALRPSDVDRMRHVNNTVYPQMVAPWVPDDGPYRATVEYDRPIPADVTSVEIVADRDPDAAAGAAVDVLVCGADVEVPYARARVEPLGAVG